MSRVSSRPSVERSSPPPPTPRDHASIRERPHLSSRTEVSRSISGHTSVYTTPCNSGSRVPSRKNNALTVESMQTSPYETQLYTPSRGNSGMDASPHRHADAPPTPPDSLSKKRPSSPQHWVDNATSPASAKSVKALPGTMSSRVRNASKSRTRALNRSKGATKHGNTDSFGLGQRFKAAWKDAFRRNPIDESQFESIPNHHWTED